VDAATDTIPHDRAANLFRDDNTESRTVGLANNPIEHGVRRAGAPATTHGPPEIVTTHDSVCSREHRRA
jgi:hypothetical protein